MDNTVLRKLQLEELEILKEVKEICSRHGIRFYLCSGTLLGAARHKGFIPWDDDIDISMPYRDYKRFLGIAPKEISDQYFVQNSDTDPNFQRAFTKIRKNNTTYLEKNLIDYKIHQGIWIDIFPMVETSNKAEYRIKKLVTSFSNYCQSENYVQCNEAEFRKIIGIPGLALLKVFYLIPEAFRIRMHRKMLWFVSSGRGNYISELCPGLLWMFPKKIWSKTAYLEFEGESFPVPYYWKKYLRIHYDDYMKLPPEEQRVNHTPGKVDFMSGSNKHN